MKQKRRHIETRHQGIVSALLGSLLLGTPALSQAEQHFTLTNPLSWTRPAADMIIPRSSIELEPGETVTRLRMTNLVFEAAIPFQLDDLDGDGEWDELYAQTFIRGNQRLELTVETGPLGDAPDFAHRTDAMADAAGSPDVTKPAWESEVMTYVAYGAAQVDAIGKIAPQLSIDFLYNEPTHSQHGFTVQHGQDFMSVSNTMGAHAPFVQEPDGTITRPWSTDAYVVKGPLENDARHTSRVITRGPLRAIVETRIDNWRSELGEYACTIRYDIAANQRHTRVSVAYDVMPETDTPPVIGAGVRAFREDAYLDESAHRVVVASRNVLERTLLVPWMGRAIITGDELTAKPIRIPDGAAPEAISGSGPNYGLLFPDADRAVEYAFIASWSLDDTITAWPQYQRMIDRLQEEISFPVIVETVSPKNEN
jgi:hypothetical protein